MSENGTQKQKPTMTPDREKAIDKLLTYLEKQGAFDSLYITAIQTQSYQPGKPFPGLLYESPGVTANGRTVGPHAIVLTDELGYVMVAPGETLRVGGLDGLGNPRCIGRVPINYVPVKGK